MQNYSEKSPSYFAHARKEIAPLLPKRCGRVLEIGCGSGGTLAWLQQDYRAAHTVGVEVFQAAAQRARAHVDEVHCIDFEHQDIPLESSEFDVVLCLDVLEHMIDPWRVVDRLVSTYLKPGGLLIVSVPNVRHYSVVLPLLFQGRWDYQDAGLLDRTHLRFFTGKTARELLFHPQVGPVLRAKTYFSVFSRKGLLNVLTIGLFKDLLTYQYFLAVQKNDDAPT